MHVSATEVMGYVQVALLVVGVIVLWRVALSPEARGRRQASPLPTWDLPLVDFAVFSGCVFAGAFCLLAAAAIAGKIADIRGDAATVLGGAAMQVGMIAGALLAPVPRGPHSTAQAPGWVLLAGAVTFLASFPLIAGTAAVAQQLAQAAGFPPQPQDAITMLIHMESRGLLAAMIVLAVVVAPVGEEMVFRGGVFRFLRGRVPRWAALLLPGVFFAALHVNWRTFAGLDSFAPLVVLAVLFSLAYERTGHLGVPIVAHALFNLNTIVGILTGFVKPA
ncbi:MAG: CPBP family intramembrane metalloprotease [Opitutaceae bacterium]|nr:CPBP family intramembrane metalloprotease [Opitutaceae bacterium]